MPRRSQFWRYGVAVLAVTIVLIVKLFLATLIHQESPFMLFFVAILVSTWYGGMAAGLAATALAAILCDYFFLSPKHVLLVANWEQGVRLAIFILEATCICSAITILNSARVRAQQSQVAALHCQAILLQSEERFRLLVEEVKDYAIFMLDPNGLVASWNAGAARITGYKAREVIGQHYSRFYTYSDIESGIPQQELQQAIAYEQLEVEGWRLRRDGSQFWANVVTTSLKDSNGQIKGFSKIVRDITERQRPEELLHLARLNLAEYIAQLSAHLSSAANLNSNRVNFKIETEPIWVSSNIAIPCGAIVNELVINALKHAFPDRRGGQIHITMTQDRHHVILKIGDNGIGLSSDFDWQNPESLGLQIVTTLVNQIQGSIALTNREFGTEFTITFTI